jgi:histone deacetylase complex regulatory component SIN3
MKKNTLIIELLQVAIIFKGYPDIRDEFTHFLPQEYSNYFATQNSVRRDI